MNEITDQTEFYPINHSFLSIYFPAMLIIKKAELYAARPECSSFSVIAMDKMSTKCTKMLAITEKSGNGGRNSCPNKNLN